MRMAIRAILRAVFLLMLVDSHPLRAQANREQLPVPMVQILQTMYSKLDQGNYDMAYKFLKVLTPVVQTLTQKEGVDLFKEMESAIRSQNKERIDLAFRRMVIMDISDLMSFVNDLHPLTERDKVHARISLLEYYIISPRIAETNFMVDQRVKNNFRKMLLLFNEDELFGQTQQMKDFGRSILQDLRSSTVLKK
ncbi:MAG: hypothetical protein HY204_01160 [Nitrospirae bacterium]|nr:hypothetical protein [Nitrospirota bacterium]